MGASFPRTISTLGVCIDDGYRIALHCERGGATACHHHRWLDLEKLASRLGREHGSLHHDLVPHLWCPKCGSRQVSIRLQPPSH